MKWILRNRVSRKTTASMKGGLKKRGLNLEGMSGFEERRTGIGMKPEYGMAVEENHFHQNWNVRQLALSPFSVFKKISSYPLQVANLRA